MRPYRDLSRKIGLLLLICLLAGCSALRLGYANGERVTYWWLDGYVDFNAAQKPWVKSRIKDLMAWHRKTQLPDYARLLARFREQLRHEATPADALADYAALKKRALTTVERALPDLADLALSLEPRQIAQIANKFESNNDHYRRDYLHGDLAQRQQFRFKKVMKQAEYWFGDFSDEQEARIRAASDARPLNNELWLAERLRAQQQLIALLRQIRAERPSRAATIDLLRTHVNAVAELVTYDENKAFFDASREGNAQLAALIINIATPAQKAHAAKRLEALIEDCNRMAAQPR